MNYKSFILVILLSIICQYIYSQKTEKVLVVNFQNDEVLAPIIINYLNELNVYKGDTIEKAFDKILVLNYLKNHISEQNDIKKMIDYFQKRGIYIDLSIEGENIHDKIYESLSSYTTLLNINTYNLNGILEFQFALYTNIIGSGKDIIPTKDARIPNKTLSTIINLQKDDYIELLKESLLKIFQNSNHSPISVISVNEQINNYPNVFTVCVGDTIVLSGIHSYDIDSKKERLSYNWYQFNSDLSKFNSINSLDYKSVTNILIPNTLGNFSFGLIVNDGITSSILDTIKISVIKKPCIYTKVPKITNFYHRNLYDLIIGKKALEYKLNISSNIPFNDTSCLIIKDLDQDKYLNQNDSLKILEWILSENTDTSKYDSVFGKFKNIKQVNIEVNKLKGGYKLSFSGNPRNGIYKYQIYEHYKGVPSNIIEFEINHHIYPLIRFKYEYGFTTLSSPIFDSSVSYTNNFFKNLISDSSENISVYQSDVFFSLCMISDIELDINLKTLSFIFSRKGGIFEYQTIPIFRTNIPFVNKKFIFTPQLSLNSLVTPSKDYYLLGYGIAVEYKLISPLSINFGFTKLTGDDFNGTSFVIGLFYNIFNY